MRIFYISLIILLISCDTNTPRPIYELNNSILSGVDFKNQLDESSDLNILEYLYYYMGGGVAIEDFNDDGLLDLFFTGNEVPCALYLQREDRTYENVTASSGIDTEGTWSTGVALGDANGDGHIDVYLCQVHGFKSLQGRNRLYINDGNGVFTDQTDAYGLKFRGYSTHASFFDYDNDGDLDLYVLNHSVHKESNYRDSDVRYTQDSLSGDRLYRNDIGTFTDVSESAGILQSSIGFGLGLSTRDINQDGFTDIYVSNDFHENDYLYINQGNGTFKEQGESYLSVTSKFSMGNAVEDLNNDHFPDIVSLDMRPIDEQMRRRTESTEHYTIYRFKKDFGYSDQLSRNTVHLSEYAPNGLRFTEQGQFLDMDDTDWSWSTVIDDFNNDGQADCYISNGIPHRPNDLDFVKYFSDPSFYKADDVSSLIPNMPSGYSPDFLFLQDSLGFNRHAITPEHIANGISYADLNNDGSLDIILNRLNQEAAVINVPNENNYVSIRLRQEGMNKHAVGAEITLKGDGFDMHKAVHHNLGFMSSKPAIAHFGLGTYEGDVSATVKWPDGKTSTHTINKINQQITINKEEQSLQQETPSRPSLNADYILLEGENSFSYIEKDFEPLLLYPTYFPSPAMATGDVNNDGEDDIITVHQDTIGLTIYYGPDLKERSVIPLDDMSKRTITDIALSDIDGNGSLDIIAVQGGSVADRSPKYYRPLLWTQENGQFTLRQGAFPGSLFLNASSVSIADVNADRRPDVFMAARSVPGVYGMIPQSYLLINTPRGFQQMSAGMPIGMITDTQSGDINNDGINDVVMTGEFMPTYILYGGKNGFTFDSIPHSSGMHQAVRLSDLNQDGRLDVICGNLGLNTGLPVSEENPLRQYTADFDDNDDLECIMTYVRDGKELPIFYKDGLALQINKVKKDYTSYEAFSQDGFHDIFSTTQYISTAEASSLSSTYYAQNADGTFTAQALPQKLQLSPIIDMVSINDHQVLCIGNITDIDPIIGVQKNIPGTFLGIKDQAWFTESTNVDLSQAVRVAYLHSSQQIAASFSDGSIRVFSIAPRVQ